MSSASAAMPAYDVAVIGAGIIGCASAWRLAQRGLRVAVLERESAPATGSTGRSAAGVRLQFSDATNILLSAHSLREYREMPEAAFRPIGYLFMVPEEHWPAHRAAVALQRELGAPVQVLSPEQATHVVPADIRGLGGATWCAQDGIVDPHGICLAYAARARACGAIVMLRAGVEAIDERPDGWVIHAGRERLRAATIVNAAGAWAGRVGAMAGLDVPVNAARRVVFASAPLPEALTRAHPYPLTVDVGTGFYFRSEGERLIFGQSNPDDEGFSEGIDWPWLDTVVASALDRFPWFEQVSLDRKACWWGYYEITPDHQPVVGIDPTRPRWINACGFSGHGVQQAAAIGQIVAQLATGADPMIDVRSLAIDRFRGPAMGAHRPERLIV